MSIHDFYELTFEAGILSECALDERLLFFYAASEL